MSTVTHETKEDGENEVRKLLVLSKCPPSPGIDLATITKLDLFQAGLTSLPSSLGQDLPNLSILFCMKNKFEEVPEVIGQCPNLQMVSFKSNQIKSIHPEALQPQMRWLILTDNKIASLPSTIGRCTKLQKFMLSGNLIEQLPKEIASCHNLELIRLASNRLAEPPMELLNLPKLSWVALSDNPFLSLGSQNGTMNDKEIHLDLFEDEHLDNAALGIELGKGASGITRKYTTLISQNGNETMEEVAVKEYSATITSDGNPQEERKVSMVASSLGCSSLVKVFGRTKNGNLIMELLQNYNVLANPPSMESCSRDVYDEEMRGRITEKRALAIVEQLLISLMKLHDVGICHGDFYGHNILISDEDEERVWLTDFGAAFFYDKGSPYGKAIERVESRAFGHLVAELASALPSSSSENDVKEMLSQFALSCNELKFKELHQRWEEIKI
jgi:tRNA A-37 threonylcarbamoyl transferase component Bud32